MNLKIIQFISPFFVIHLTLLLSIGFAQESSDQLSTLHQNITDVTLKDVVYKQTFHEKNGSCIVSIKIINSDNQKEEEYECNLSDLNEYKIELKASKQSLKIVCETKGSKNVVRIYENDKIKKYTNKFEFYAKDIENGKLIVSELQNLVKRCTENQNDLPNILGNSPDLKSAIQYLKENVRKVSVNENTLDQGFSVNEDFKALCSFEITDNKNSKNIRYNFNAADINISTIDFETKNEFVYVKAQTKGNAKLIEVFENGEKVNFTNKFEFYAEDIEEGRKFKNVVTYFVQESENLKSQELSNLEKLNSLIELNDFFKTKLKNESINDVSYKQSFTYENPKMYLCTFNVVNENKGELVSSFVNLIDLNKNNVSFNTSGSGVKIELETNGKLNLAGNSINGNPEKFTNKIILWSSGIEDARILVETMKKMISNAGEIYNPNFIEGTDNPTKIQCNTYLNQSFIKVVDGSDAFNLELKEDIENSCKLIYKEHDVTKDKTYEYKFDLNDINIHKINFSSSGKVATVRMETKGEKKYIEMFEQGTSKGYNNKIDLKVQDIENARLICEAFKNLSSHCSENLK